MRRDSTGEFAGTERFQLLRRIGGGGMGVVYEALDRERGAKVALKTLKAESSSGGGAATLQRFKNEFRWLQDLHHPNVVSFGELFAEDGRWFFTMELVDGVDFLAYVRPLPPRSPILDEVRPTPLDRPTLDLDRLRAVLPQLARGVHALHRAGKVHRDIKPSNVLVTPAGRVVLVDFGLVRDTLANFSDAHVVGSVDYMAPEQAASKPVGPPADWYAVGTMLYEALTGRVPFTGAPIDVLMSKQSLPPTAPRALRADLPRDLETLCLELLAADPAARPSGEQILERLGARDPVELRAPPQQAQAPFVGRARELEVLRAAFAEATGPAGGASSGAVAVLVRGESGVGKSALVRRFTDELQAGGALVVAGRCYERESVPYKAVDGLVDSLSRHLMRLPRAQADALLPERTPLVAQIFPVLRRIESVAQMPLARVADVQSPHELRTRVFATLRELLGRLAAEQPVVLAIDDFQWTDTDSLALLAEVLRGPDAPRLLLVATVRGESGDERGTDLSRGLSGDVRHLEVGRLLPDEARQLTQLLLGGAGPASQAIADEAAGHPLFIDELVRHFAAQGGGGELPHLDDALWSRVSRLEVPARQLLELVVVAAGPLQQEVVAVAAKIEFAELSRRVALLRGAQLVRTGGARRTDAVEPYHDRVREAVLSRLDERARKRWHERLALALEAAGARTSDPEALCVHWLGSGDRERAAFYAGLAATHATEALAFDRAARLYRLAIELRPIEGAAFQARLGDVLAAAGRGAEASRAYLLAAEGASPGQALELKRRAAEQLLISGHIDVGLDALRSVLAASGMKLPSSERGALASLAFERLRLRWRGLDFTPRDPTEVPPAELSRIDVCWSVGVGLGLVDAVRGFDFQVRHLRLALEAGERYRVARGLGAEAVWAAASGATERAQRILDVQEALARELEHPHALGLWMMSAGFAAFFDGRWKRARKLLGDGETIFRERCTGVAWELDTLQVMLLSAMYFLGELTELSARVPELSRGAVERGDRFASTNFRTALHVVALIADDPERARRESAEAIQKWSQRGFHTQHYHDVVAQAQAALYSGDGAEAERIVAARWAELSGQRRMRLRLARTQLFELRARSLLAAAARLDGSERRRRLRAAARDARRVNRTAGFGAGLALLLEASIAQLDGDAARALERLEQAERRFEELDMALHAQIARRRRGQLLGGDGGRELFTQADAWLRDRRVQNPARLSTLLAPGFPDD
ncbi:MAG TPA: protein kinase [Polyangia bacterium]|nr:protein kinase [Polyangia bacterium]